MSDDVLTGPDDDVSLADVLPDDIEAAAEDHAVLATPVSEPAPVDAPPLLEVSGLRTWFSARSGDVHAVDGVDLTVGRGEVLGLVGESGSGKSVTMLSVLRLVDKPGRIVSGSVRFDGIDLVNLGKKELHAIRGNRISMVFQQPNASLHPCFNAARQISEVYEIHRNSSRKAGVEKAVDMLRAVGIPDPQRRAKSFPHQLSGGQAQRVMIAMALAAEPELLIADEPTTALDVTIQAQILDLMRKLQAERGTSVVLITHDLGVVAEMAHRVAVMYGGQVVEQAPVADLFANPKHPYTHRPARLGAGHRQASGVAHPDQGSRPDAHRPQARMPLRRSLPERIRALSHRDAGPRRDPRRTR